MCGTVLTGASLKEDWASISCMYIMIDLLVRDDCSINQL